MAEIVMLVGLPGSGKSTYAEMHSTEYVVHSSDRIRKELLGDINDQTNNEKVFQELHRRIREDLKAGKKVMYDATNIKFKRRMAFLRELKDIDCKKTALIFATPYETCLRQNWMRERKVPDEVLDRMYRGWQTPYYFEGWDEIKIEKHNDCYKSYTTSVIGWYGYNQNSPYHKHTLGEHMILCSNYVLDKGSRSELFEAAMYHDCGKPYCRFTDDNGISHYYNHEYVGAYDALSIHNLSLLASVYINYHMFPMFWDSMEDSTDVRKKYKELWGDEFYNNILLLHEADAAS